MIPAALIALALAGGLESADGRDPPAVPQPVPEPSRAGAPPEPGAPAPPPPPDAGVVASARSELEAPRPALDHRGWRHAVGLGLHSTTFFSKEHSQYTFHSASLGYMGSLGARGPFLHAFGLFTLQARQDGHVYDTADYYRRRTGADFLLGWHWRWAARPGVEAEAGPGLHGTLIYLPGKPGYRDFSAFPLGVGAAGALWWGTSAERLARTVTLGAYASLAYDFRDPLHANDLDRGYTLRAGLCVGLGQRR